MPKGKKQKQKILYLGKIFHEETDEDHPVKMEYLLKRLSEYGITSERKSVSDDIRALKEYGLDIIAEKRGRNIFYFLAGRDFDTAEIRMLADTVRSSKFITLKKSEELVCKLEKLSSRNEALKIKKDIFVPGRVKSGNTNIFINIDTLQSAMEQDLKVSFMYFRYGLNGEEEIRPDKNTGEKYRKVSPWGLVYDDSKYYLIAYEDGAVKPKHFRVDKMKKVCVLPGENRYGELFYNELDKNGYTSEIFRMFSGETVEVTLICKNELSNVIADQFGRNTVMQPVSDNEFKIRTIVEVSKQFYGWIFSLNGACRIVSPENVVNGYREMLKKAK